MRDTLSPLQYQRLLRLPGLHLTQQMFPERPQPVSKNTLGKKTLVFLCEQNVSLGGGGMGACFALHVIKKEACFALQAIQIRPVLPCEQSQVNEKQACFAPISNENQLRFDNQLPFVSSQDEAPFVL